MENQERKNVQRKNRFFRVIDPTCYYPVICPSHSLLNEHLAFTHKKCLVGERGNGDKQVLKQSPTSSPPALEIRPKSSGNAKRDGTFKEPLPPKKYHRESPPQSEVYAPPGFFWTFAKKLKVKKTKTQAKKTQNSRIFCPKLKIPANFSEILEGF